MAGLGEVVRALAGRDGVEAVLVLSADGLPIEQASSVPFEAESLAALTATRIIAVDLRDDALRLARDVGAHHAILSDEKAADGIRELVGPAPGGADVVLDFVGAQATVDLARAVVTTGGDVAIVGLAGGALPMGFGMIPWEVRVTVTFWGTKAELADVIALAREGRITAHVERFTLDAAQAAYDRLRAGHVQGRAVVVPSTRSAA